MGELSPRYWERKPLRAMTRAEWEALCDGCGRCCLHKLEDEDTGELIGTNIACRLLDRKSCRCKDYKNRRAQVPDCVQLSPEGVSRLNWLPATCAYRLLDEGKPLPEWHPLITGDPESVHRAGISVRGWTVSEDEAGPIEHHLVEPIT